MSDYYMRLDNPILDSLELSVRADRVLRAWGRIKTIDDFMALDARTVMALKGAGKRTWLEVKMLQAALREPLPSLAPPAPQPTREAGVFTARGVHELHQMVSSLASQGFRIVTVIDTQNGDYHVVAQREM